MAQTDAAPAPATPSETAALEREALASLSARAPALARAWAESQPFRHLVIEDLLPVAYAEALLRAYPPLDAPGWVGKGYVGEQRKFSMASGMPPALEAFFAWTSSDGFRAVVEEITGIPKLLGDPELRGGGLHQILPGGYLDVHIDYNYHPTTKHHRRLNLLLYLNRDWQPEWQGRLELWDMRVKRQIADVVPLFNRAVLFETNEISFHGHPAPLACPPGRARRSLAVYYYSVDRDVIAPEHNTIHVATSGLAGRVKTLRALLGTARARVREHGVRGTLERVAKKALRRARGLPPENR